MFQIATGVPRAPDSDRFSTPSRASEGRSFAPLENSILVYAVESPRYGATASSRAGCYAKGRTRPTCFHEEPPEAEMTFKAPEPAGDLRVDSGPPRQR